ncbi:MAG: hypothetical protein ABI692_02145 [Terracoccus sp.]
MNRQPNRSTWLRVAGVVAITATITLAAACSDQDTVDSVPPPWPTRTVQPEGPASVPGSTAGTAATSHSTPPTSTSTTTTTKSTTPKPTRTSTTQS